MIQKDCAYDLRKGYYSVLTASPIMVGAHQVKVYDEVAPSDAVAPYIILGIQTSVGLRSKDTFQREATIELNVFNIWASNEGGKKINNDITNAIVNKVLTGSSTFGIQQYLTDWQVINCEYQSNSVISQVPMGWQVEENVIFTQLLNQLN